MTNIQFVLTLCFFSIFSEFQAQELFFTREGKISFFSEAPLENIEAHNNRGSSVYNASTGELEFSVLIQGFIFEKSLMQEHFNENYMESQKFPRATFKGKIRNHELIDLSKDGIYPFTIEGEMEIRSISQDLITKGEFIVNDGKISAETKFELAVGDYDINIPAVVTDNIARILEVKVKVDYRQLKR